jgi:hypothetical protein
MRWTIGWMPLLVLAALAGRPSTARAQRGREIECESRSNKYNFCDVNTGGSVRLVRQISDTRCVLDRTWGYDWRGIWVDRGCRARFAVGGSGAGWENGGNGRVVTCESRDNRYEYCRVRTRGDVRVRRQLSRDSCRPGSSWGFDRDGIWVADGCRAEFEVGYYETSWDDGQRQVRCESEDQRYRRCRTWTWGEVRLQRQLSNTRCVRGSNWGFDLDGIWVDDGCRAIFFVGNDPSGGGWGNWNGGGGTGGNWNGGGGTGDSWDQLQSRATSSCTRLASQRGFEGIGVQQASRRNDDIAVVLTGRLGNGRYRVSCLYDTSRNRADILGQERY